DATPADRGAANINYERKPLAVPGTWNPGTNYADSRYQLPQIDTIWPILAPLGNAAATKTTTDGYAATCPKAQTYQSTANKTLR
ncbi:hypothetical protein ACL1FV_09545, partial [Corynebacterium striatum]